MVYKQGNIVTITYPGDVQGNIPRSEIGVVFTLPAEYHPKFGKIHIDVFNRIIILDYTPIQKAGRTPREELAPKQYAPPRS